MNVRQRKKAFKKKHGYNPVNMQKKESENGKTICQCINYVCGCNQEYA